MNLPDVEDAAAILANDGGMLQRLTLRLANGDATPVLVNAEGRAIAPWEMEIVRWPWEAEPLLLRGGYLRQPQPELELWCNCAD